MYVLYVAPVRSKYAHAGQNINVELDVEPEFDCLGLDAIEHICIPGIYFYCRPGLAAHEHNKQDKIAFYLTSLDVIFLARILRWLQVLVDCKGVLLLDGRTVPAAGSSTAMKSK